MGHEQQDIRLSYPRMVSIDEDEIFKKIDFFIFDDFETDTLIGTNKNDALYGYNGDNTLFGRGGDDYFHINPGCYETAQDGRTEYVPYSGVNTYFGGPGEDMVLYSGYDKAVSVDFASSKTAGGGVTAFIDNQPRDTLVSIEGLEGSMSGDILKGNDVRNVFYGDGGADLLWGRGGHDSLCGGDGDDILDGGAGNDVLYGNHGADILRGGEGADLMEGGEGRDVFVYEGRADLGDTILDFSRQEGDAIDVSRVELASLSEGDRGSHFDAMEPPHVWFSGLSPKAYAVWYKNDDSVDDSVLGQTGGITLFIDTDGDAKTAEIQSHILGLDTLTKADLIF